MHNLIKKNITIRKGFITGVVIIVLSNIIFIALYYDIYLVKRITDNYSEASERLEEKLDYLSKEIQDYSDIDKYLTTYVEENEKTSITLENSNNKLIKEYKTKDLKKNNVMVSSIISHNNEFYLITLTEQIDILSSNEVIHFMIFEIICIVALTLVGVAKADDKILNPITKLSKDLSNYKLGIFPKKRKPHSRVDIIQNDFVDLVTELEEEKEKQHRIIASISHDIKTPLTSILGYSELLLNNEKISDKTKTKYANTIHNKSLEMKEIIEEFDDYLSCNIKDPNKAEKISISHLTDYLNNYYKEELKEKNIEFKIKTNCPSIRISVDLSKFKRVFSNIITNSIRHFDKERKMLNINIKEQKSGKIIFEIADNGTGCKDDLVKIFEPLYTTDKSRKISGLGLPICKEIVESHGGTIRAENNKLGGLSIIFDIDSCKEE